MDKLKPCPFCGDSNVRVYIKGVDRVKYGACCENCDARAGRKPTKKEAIEAWNRRAEQTDTKPIEIGEWLEDEYAYFRCSECGYEQDQLETVTPYCPGCGAHMEDESEVTED